MGYRLSLKEIADILDRFYDGASLRKISFRLRRSGKPISPGRVWDRIAYWVPTIWEAVRSILESRPLLTVGDIWEMDGTYLKGPSRVLVIVRDIATSFILNFVIALTEDVNAAIKTLRGAVQIAHKYPKVLRVDGNPAFRRAAEKVFRGEVKVEVHKRIQGLGQNQSIEAIFRGFKKFLNSKHGIHSKKKCDILVIGWILYHNFVKGSSQLLDTTPSQVAGWDSNAALNSDNLWEPLIMLAEEYRLKRERENEKRKLTSTESFKSHRNGKGVTLDSFLY